VAFFRVAKLETQEDPMPSARPQHLAGLAALACTAAVLWAQPAQACGGCFNMEPPPPPKPGEPIISSPVVQDAERVLFVRDEASKVSHVWVEVRYTGLAKDFGWVLPVPKLPKVGVGSIELFNRLELATKPLYFLKYQGSENCNDVRMGCQLEPVWMGDASGQDAPSSAADAGSWGGGPPPSPKVEVLASGTTGPYDYTVVKGSDASVLYKWLTDRGYVTPPKAQPILQAHIAKGDVFVAIKLSNGQGVQSIRPITLEMDDAEPCVPLRLTAIAAAEEMSVQVLVAGPGRAVVKNHLDVTINPLRLKLIDQYGSTDKVQVDTKGYLNQEPSNYAQVMAAAIDEAGGRAFVTEASLAPSEGSLGSGFVTTYTTQQLNKLAAATNWLEVANSGFGPWPTTAEMADAVALPGAMTQAFADTAPLQVIAELRACASYWQQIGSAAGDNFSGPVNPDCALPNGKVYVKAKLMALPANGAAMAKGIDTDLLQPSAKVWDLLHTSARLTRLAMRISPDEMDRDPVFAFNPSLAKVAPQRQIPYHIVCPNGWNNEQLLRLSIEGLGSWVFIGSNPIDPRFIKAPAALSMAVLEEQGAPVVIAPVQAELVSAAIAGALPGKASLPENLVVKPGSAWTPPPSDPLVTKLGPWPQPLNCKPKAGWVNGKIPGAAVPEPDSGPVPGIDAQGGWADGGLSDAKGLSDGGSTAPQGGGLAGSSDDGCNSAPAGRLGGWSLLALMAVSVLRLGRRRELGRRGAVGLGGSFGGLG
jgi:hypothetical protein